MEEGKSRIDLHMLVRRHRLSSVLLSTAVWVSPNRRGTRPDAFPNRVTLFATRRSTQPTMEQEPFALGQDVQVVDPDVRGHVYSLVTAVC